MPIRRLNPARRLSLAIAGAGALMLTLGTAWAAPPLVEVIAYAHPPVQSALKPLRDWLAQQGGKVRVVEIDMESREAEARLKALGIKGHVPVVVLVDGRYQHKRADGSAVEFVNFPAGPGTPPGVKGTWSAADVQAAVTARP
jgi:hypothetical protein